MRILSMTATFGKLERQTLTLQPGLNIIEAPNEWGKSTWCAFIVAMLYGISTKEHTTKEALADKEHYAPWSGALMEGQMDIDWNGRLVTLERRTKGRMIFGDFRAYETETGLDVPELTASNCGMMLLGVERSVFTRAGFLKMSDLPVTQDDALRRRLNSLVTTGDEGADGEKLAQTLKDLKNKCRWNQKGLLPQAEAERDRLQEQLCSLQELNDQTQRLQQRQQELEQWIDKLQNHKVALNYAQSQADRRHIQDASAARDAAKAQVDRLAKECSALPTAEAAERSRSELQRLHNESMSLQMEQQMLPNAPEKPACSACFDGLTGEQAMGMAREDAQKAEQCAQGLATKKKLNVLGFVALAVTVISGVAAVFWLYAAIFSGAFLLAAAGLLLASWTTGKKWNGLLDQLNQKYKTSHISQWLLDADAYTQALQSYESELAQHRQMLAQLNARREDMIARIREMTDGEAIGVCLQRWERICLLWQAYADAQRDYQRAKNQLAALQAINKEVLAPTQPDDLNQSLSETDALLQNAAYEQKQNQLRLGQLQGQAKALGQETALREQLNAVVQRINHLEDTYLALEIAQKALTSTTSELQRRFAPRISKRAEELFGKLTDGRYRKMMLAEDLSVHVSTQQETTTRPSRWRSDGTIDQLYMALRLAVAEELTPDAPLVLDDAMVRFDDDRLTAALHILQEMAKHKQVILFTCQSREKNVLEK